MEETKDKEKSKKKSKILFFIFLTIASTLSAKFFLELNIFYSILVGIIVAVGVFLAIKLSPKKKKYYTKEDFDKLSSEEIRKKIEQNEDFNKSGRIVLDTRKDCTTREIIGECFTDMLMFSPAILIFGLMLMGALGNIADIPREDFIVNATSNVMTGANITLNMFYDIGYESSRPYAYLFLFYLAVFMAWIYPVIILIYRFVRRYLKNGRDNNKGCS